METPTQPAAPPVTAPAGITVTLGDLIEAESALDRLLLERLSAQVAYRVARLARLVKVETKFFHERREALIRQFGVEVPPTEAEKAQGATSMIRVTPQFAEEFGAKLREVAEVSVTIAATPIALADLTAATMTGADVLRLGPFLAESSP